jgi:hypothetical protein
MALAALRPLLALGQPGFKTKVVVMLRRYIRVVQEVLVGSILYSLRSRITKLMCKVKLKKK